MASYPTAWARVCFADARRTKEKDILGLADEVAGGQIINVFAVDGRIETPVEVFQCFQATEIGGLGAAFHQPLLADIDFVLADQFQELGMAQPVGDGFLQAHVQGLQQAGEAELFQGVFKMCS